MHIRSLVMTSLVAVSVITIGCFPEEESPSGNKTVDKPAANPPSNAGGGGGGTGAGGGGGGSGGNVTPDAGAPATPTPDAGTGNDGVDAGVPDAGTPAPTATHTATLSGANEVPTPVNTTETGTGTFTLTPGVGGALPTLSWRITHNVINPTAAHLHTGAAGINGGVAITLTTASPIVGSMQVPSAAFVTALDAAGIYVNIHTAASGGGRIRGQIIKN
jgi:hypothetical protein